MRKRALLANASSVHDGMDGRGTEMENRRSTSTGEDRGEAVIWWGVDLAPTEDRLWYPTRSSADK